MKWGHCRDLCLLAPRLLVVVLLLVSSHLPWARCQEDGSSSQRAILEIVLYNPVEHGGYVTQSYKLIGMFSVAGTSISAEGRIIQLHPLGLCNTNDYDELYEYGWVGVVKLERPEFEPEPCLSVFGKAKRAVQRGATAVVFDISDNPVAADALLETDDRLSRPVIVMQGADAAKLMGIVNMQSEARIRIIYSPQESSQESVEISHKEYFGMGIFVAVFLLFCLICIFVMLKLKWRHRDRQISQSNLAKRAIAKLETRKYESSCRRQQRMHVHSSAMSVHSSISECCAICLEGYKEGQVLRVMPCYHEFHRLCVDPWLENHGTCPLCKVHIADQMDDLDDEDNGDIQDQEAIQGATGSAVGVSPDARSQSQISDSQGATSSAYQFQQHHHQHNQHQQSHQSCSSSRYSLFSASGVGSHRSFISMPFSSPHSEYAPLHLVQSGPVPQYLHTCPSCRGTLGSEPSSTISNTAVRSDQALPLSKTREQQDILHTSDYVNRCTYVREYTDPRRESSGTNFVTFQPPPRPFVHPSNSHTTQVFHATSSDSPVSMPCSCSFQAARSTAVYAHHAARLYIPVDCPSHLQSSSSSSNQHDPSDIAAVASNIKNDINTASALNMQLLTENQDVRTASATAVHGSCSSDATNSWECDNCRGLSDSSATGAACSNRSTYGSSDNKDSSDVSSFDSNIYRGKGSSSSSDEREGFFTASASSNTERKNTDAVLKLSTSSKQPLLPQSLNVSHGKNKNLLLKDISVYPTKRRPLSRRDSSSSPCLSDISAGAWSWNSSSAFVSSPISRSKEETDPCKVEMEDKKRVVDDCVEDTNLEGAGEALASHVLNNETTKINTRSRSASSRPSRLLHQRPHRTHSTPAVACFDDAITREPSPFNEKDVKKETVSVKVLKKHSKSSSVFSRRSSPHISRKDLSRFSEKHHKNNIAFCNYNSHSYVKSSIREKKITGGGARSKTHSPESRTAQYKISGEAQSAMKDLRKASLINSKAHSKGSVDGNRRKLSTRPTAATASCSWAVANSHAPNYHYIGQCNVCRRQHVIISSQPALLQSVDAGISSQSQTSTGGSPQATQVAATHPMANTMLCQVCHRSTQLPQSGATKKMTSRRSMVLFTEPQGAFITIPLLEKEQFDPVNGV